MWIYTKIIYSMYKSAMIEARKSRLSEFLARFRREIFSAWLSLRCTLYRKHLLYIIHNLKRRRIPFTEIWKRKTKKKTKSGGSLRVRQVEILQSFVNVQLERTLLRNVGVFVVQEEVARARDVRRKPSGQALARPRLECKTWVFG